MSGKCNFEKRMLMKKKMCTLDLLPFIYIYDKKEKSKKGSTYTKYIYAPFVFLTKSSLCIYAPEQCQLKNKKSYRYYSLSKSLPLCDKVTIKHTLIFWQLHGNMAWSKWWTLAHKEGYSNYERNYWWQGKHIHLVMSLHSDTEKGVMVFVFVAVKNSATKSTLLE